VADEVTRLSDLALSRKPNVDFAIATDSHGCLVRAWKWDRPLDQPRSARSVEARERAGRDRRQQERRQRGKRGGCRTDGKDCGASVTLAQPTARRQQLLEE
jgi:hypothetical protein